ncbi:MAG: conjugal transfer protein TraF [Campylobacterota bacterium]|nr:conjugal transfer protein TraF [Campylobacterota bacterium]
MSRKIHLSLIAALSLTSLNAMEFKTVGFKATGMGGAGVASTRGSMAGYYNPALLRFSDHTSEFSINAGVKVQESNLVENMDNLSDIDFDGALERIGDNATTDNSKTNSTEDNQNIQTAQDIISSIGSNNGLNISATPSLSAQISDAFAIGVYATADIAMNFNISDDKDQFIFENDGKYFRYDPTANNGTGQYTETSKSNYESHSIELNNVEVNAVALSEIPISYAKAYDFNSGTWSFGINLKPMGLVTYSDTVSLGESSQHAEDNSDDTTNETTYKANIGIDVGVAYRPKDSKVTLGLIGKNINNPTFKVDQASENQDIVSEDQTIDAMYRAGISLPIWNDNVEFAFDVDLTKNDTLVAGEQSQMMGGGIELHPASWFSLRVGAMQDMASEKFDDGTIMTAGLGFGLKWAQIDISAMMGTNTGTYEGEEVPTYAALNVSLVSKWGDGYNKKTPPSKSETTQKPIKRNNTLSPQRKEEMINRANQAHSELDNNI